MAKLFKQTVVFSTAWLFLASSTSSAASLIEPFIGEYAGHVTFEDEGIIVDRDLGVTIEETDEGFLIEWDVTTLRPDKSPKTKSYSINFTPTKRDSVFQAAMQPDLFGGQKPLDPIKGDPYVWSRITDGTLTVFALLIHDDGGYELLIYDRSLADNGLDLTFSRIKNGEQLKTIESKLEKQ